MEIYYTSDHSIPDFADSLIKCELYNDKGLIVHSLVNIANQAHLHLSPKVTLDGNPHFIGEVGQKGSAACFTIDTSPIQDYQVINYTDQPDNITRFSCAPRYGASLIVCSVGPDKYLSNLAQCVYNNFPDTILEEPFTAIQSIGSTLLAIKRSFQPGFFDGNEFFTSAFLIPRYNWIVGEDVSVVRIQANDRPVRRAMSA
jgi:hypothetical protein